MTIYTIGFTKKTANEFFSLLKEKNIDLLIDIRLNNKSQLAGFTKGDDLKYFLKEICNCNYDHCEEYAPTKEILTAYQHKDINWTEYEKHYKKLINDRGCHIGFVTRFTPHKKVALLCSETTAEKCHRRLIAEMIREADPNLIVHHI